MRIFINSQKKKEKIYRYTLINNLMEKINLHQIQILRDIIFLKKKQTINCSTCIHIYYFFFFFNKTK
jgi:hypothetical protein